MRSLIKKIKSQKQYAYKFEDIDEQDVKKRLNIQSKAKENGKINLPATTSSERDENEIEIINYFKKLIDINAAKLNGHIKLWHNKINALKLNLDFTRLESIPKQLESKYLGLESAKFNRLKNLYQEFKNSEKERVEFKNENGITKMAEYPESKIFWWVVILFLFLVEIAVNSVFFSKGSQLGILGGIFEALSISIVNVGVGLFFGMFLFPFKNLKGINLTKSVTLIFTMLMPIGLFTFNLLMAHYRDVYIVNPMEASTADAMANFYQNPFLLSDTKSWILVIVGFLIGLIAWSEGYKYDDPYPGYGKIDRRVKNRKADYDELKDEIEEELNTLKEDALKQIKSLHAMIEEKSKSYTQALLSNNHSIDSFLVFEKKLGSICNRLLKFYEETNLEFRNDPAPNYFKTQVEIAGDPILFENKRISVDDKMEKKYQALNESVNKSENDILRLYNQTLSKIAVN